MAESDAFARKPWILGDKSLTDVSDDICGMLDGKPTRLWWTAFLVSAGVCATGALAVVMVLPPMHADELKILEEYRSRWSLVAEDTCEDTEKFIEAVWSASRGITWVDPALYHRLNEVRAVNRRRSTPVVDFEG